MHPSFRTDVVVVVVVVLNTHLIVSFQFSYAEIRDITVLLYFLYILIYFAILITTVYHVLHSANEKCKL